MSENDANGTATGTTPAAPTTPPEGGMFTQADVDRIVGERIARERQKFADYDDLKAAAAQASEFQGQYEDLVGKVSTTENDLWRERAARRHGLDDELMGFLVGEDADELDARAKTLAEKLNAATPPPTRPGPRPDPSQGKGGDIPLNGDPILDSLKSKLGIP